MNLPAAPSDAVRKLNPHLFPAMDRVARAERQQDGGPALVGARAPSQAGAGRVRPRVGLVVFRRRALDSDNMISGLKPLRDEIARWLGVDDTDACVDWEYSLALTRGEEGVAVRVER